MFQALQVHRQQMEALYGGPLDWQELPGRNATRVAEYLPDADVTLEGYLGPVPRVAARPTDPSPQRGGRSRRRPTALTRSAAASTNSDWLSFVAGRPP